MWGFGSEQMPDSGVTPSKVGGIGRGKSSRAALCTIPIVAYEYQHAVPINAQSHPDLY